MSGMDETRLPSCASIFFSFAKIGAVLIGGGYAMLPLLEDEIVRRKKWTTSEEIADFFSLAQLLPGVIAINTAMLVGNRLRGLAGNLAASVGVVSVPFALIGAYAVAYSQMQDFPVVMRVLEGVRPAVAGMMLAMGWNMARKGAKGEGDRMALFVRDAKRAKRLSQKVKGIVPGRHYALVFYSSEYDEYLGVKSGTKGIAQGRRRLRVDFDGATNMPALELHHFGAGGVKPGKFSICRNRYVFRADAPEVTLTISDREVGEGDVVKEDVGLRQIVNFVEMHEYFTGGLSVEEIAVVTGRK